MSFPLLAAGSDANYCQISGDKGPWKEEYDVRFCFGTKEYMEAFSKSLTTHGIAHFVYSNGDIGYSKEDKEKVQKIGDSLIPKYIFESSGK